LGWKETRVQDERLELVEQFAAQERSRAEICRGFGVSRKTGYKWFEQYLLEGAGGLADRSRRPHHQPQAVDDETIGAILAARSRRPSWGERKLHAWLEREQPERSWPCSSTIGAVLKRYGLTRPNKRRRRAAPSSELTQPAAANQVWAIDFKGWFRTQDGVRCDPLTISDTHTRYLLRCQAMDRTGGKFVRPLMEATFREYGLPARIRSDNGAPFASTGVGGLSRLSVWWLRLGIVPERIEPGHPEQNGRHERMHRTLKQETAQPPSRTARAQQQAFDRFRRTYNEDRPHEALQMTTPASRYQPSSRSFPERLPEMEYPAGFTRRRVQPHGDVHWLMGDFFVGEALASETVGIEEVEDGWRIWFGPLPLAWLDARQPSDPTAKRNKYGRARWRAQFLDGSGRPAGSRRRPGTSNGPGSQKAPSHDTNQ
jgi:transposase InsO family protein